MIKIVDFPDNMSRTIIYKNAQFPGGGGDIKNKTE